MEIILITGGYPLRFRRMPWGRDGKVTRSDVRVSRYHLDPDQVKSRRVLLSHPGDYQTPVLNQLTTTNFIYINLTAQ